MYEGGPLGLGMIEYAKTEICLQAVNQSIGEGSG